MKIIKRNGEEAIFDIRKIETAISKANAAVPENERLSDEYIKAVAAKVGGGGGGKPNMASAGGKNPAGIDECLAYAEEVLAGQIN